MVCARCDARLALGGLDQPSLCGAADDGPAPAQVGARIAVVSAEVADRPNRVARRAEASGQSRAGLGAARAAPASLQPVDKMETLETRVGSRQADAGLQGGLSDAPIRLSRRAARRLERIEKRRRKAQEKHEGTRAGAVTAMRECRRAIGGQPTETVLVPAPEAANRFPATARAAPWSRVLSFSPPPRRSAEATAAYKLERKESVGAGGVDSGPRVPLHERIEKKSLRSYNYRTHGAWVELNPFNYDVAPGIVHCVVWTDPAVFTWGDLTRDSEKILARLGFKRGDDFCVHVSPRKHRSIPQRPHGQLFINTKPDGPNRAWAAFCAAVKGDRDRSEGCHRPQQHRSFHSGPDYD